MALTSPIYLGMDNIQLKIGSKFKGKTLTIFYFHFSLGIKHIPVGSHYIYYTLAEEKHMFKIGFFIYAKPGYVKLLMNSRILTI